MNYRNEFKNLDYNTLKKGLQDLYKIMYQLPYINLVGLPIRIHSCKIMSDLNIFLYINHKEDHQMISSIDALLS